MKGIEISDVTEFFLKKLEVQDLNSILMSLRTIPITDRETVLGDLVRIFNKSKGDLGRQFDLVCKK